MLPFLGKFNLTRGVLLEILDEGVPPGSLNRDPTSDQKIAIFHSCFQTWPLLVKNYVIITQITTAIKKRFFKSTSNSHFSLSFLFIWN